MKRTLLSLICVAAAAADLPVKQVVLYKHGVGYFERSGKLARGDSARLDFDASEMNDVLKSLTVTERGGGKISGLRYDSEDPLGRKLAEFPFQIGGAQSLSAMLDQLKGARLEMRIGNENVAGAIVTGRTAAGGDKQPEREQITLLLDTGELRAFDLGAANGMRFSDPKLQQQFRDYLAALSAARSKGRRSLYIDSTDAGGREVSASYMIPAAVWKSSYRLIFGESGAPTLEGWAIVDNTTAEDWTDVRLSLVSGRPISFVSQLYPAKYVTRPEAELADDAAARPVTHAGGFAMGGRAVDLAIEKEEKGVLSMARVAAPAPLPRADMAAPAQASAKMDSLSSIAANASAQELGELFEYRIGQPVTIRKSESAMLPFLQQQIEGRKLLIYSDHASQHPTNAAELRNSSGKTLDGGPITVYDGGAYGGEALMETLKTGDKRLISYAVDLGTRITEAFGSKAAVVRQVRASRGVLTTKTAVEETRTYTVRNVDQKAKTLVLEHPLRPQYTLLNQKPAEKTPSAYRFEIAVAPGATLEYPVSEERVYDQSYAVTSMTPDALTAYISNRNLSEAGRQQLQRIADCKTRIAETDRAIADARREVEQHAADEDRIRRNISSLNSVSGQQQQVQNYARQIETHEQQMAALRDRQAELQKRKSALESELNGLVDALAF